MPDSKDRFAGAGRTPLALLGALAAVVVTAGCPSRMSVEHGGVRQPSLAEKPYPIDCDTAHRYAARALRTRGYTITSVNRSASGGVVVGDKDGQASTMTITCKGDTSLLEATGGGSWVEQGMQFSFHQVVERGDKFWPPPKSPRVRVEKIGGPESKLWFPQEIGSAGVVAVRVFVFNGGQRALRIDPRRITAVGASGPSARAISAADAKSRVGGIDPRIEGKLLREVTLQPGEETAGFVFFPPGKYTGANVQLIDAPTGEADGYDVSFADAG